MTAHVWRRAVVLVLAVTAFVGAPRADEERQGAPVSRYQIVRTFPHDPRAFTQGLAFADGSFYEGTGLNGQSTLRKVKVGNGEVLRLHRLGAEYFGEGIAVWGDTIAQLTWQNGVGFVYDRTTFAVKRTFTYQGEGWGLAWDGKRLVMSDGTAVLRFLDPTTFKETGRLEVRDAGRPVSQLNELEYVKGELLANVWQSERIARIDPATGRVTGWIDLRGLLDPRDAAGVDVMNGIAYDAAGDRLFVTGKLWPKVFEIKILPPR